MKLKIFCYSSKIDDSELSYLAVIKNGYIVDIACSSKYAGMFSEKDQALKNTYVSLEWTKVKAKAKDLALYTHWPVHTKEFWDLLNET
jgi:hypothetical protein